MSPLDPGAVARIDQARAAVGDRLDVIVDRYRANSAADGAMAAVELHTTLVDTFEPGGLAALLGVAIGRLVDLHAEVDRLHAALAERDQAGPQAADPVWVIEPLPGVEMHRLTDDGRHTDCRQRAWGGRRTTAANARQRWQSPACAGCWPVTK